jgi:nucleoside-diphosphate-sugar epimerase
MLDLSSIEEIFSEHSPDVIVHSAWGVNEVNYRESEFNLKWQASTLKLYTLAAEHNVGHFIALGTFSETGQDIFSGESRDRSVYAETKRQTLSNLIELESQLKLPVSWLRVNYPYGFWDKRNRLISVLIEKSISKEEFHLKSPDLKLDFTHSLDIANAVRVVIEKKIRGTLEVKSDESHSLSEVQDRIRTLLLNEMTHGNNIDVLMDCINLNAGEEMWKALIPFDMGLSATIMNILESKADN